MVCLICLNDTHIYSYTLHICVLYSYVLYTLNIYMTCKKSQSTEMIPLLNKDTWHMAVTGLPVKLTAAPQCWERSGWPFSPLTSRWGAAVSFVPHQRTAAGLNESAAMHMELSLPSKSCLPPSSGGSTEVRAELWELHKSERTSFRKTHQVQIKKSQLLPRFHVIDLQISLLSYPDNFHVWTFYFLI